MNETTSTAHSAPTHEEISRRAQELWESYGRPVGRDEEIWLEAERNLRASASVLKSAPAAPRITEPTFKESRNPTASAKPRTPQTTRASKAAAR